MENHCKYSELPSDAMVSSVPLLKLVILLNDTSLCKCIYLVMVVRLCSTAGFILRFSGLLVRITCGCLCCQGKLPLSIYSSSFRRCWGSTRSIVVWCSTSIGSQRSLHRYTRDLGLHDLTANCFIFNNQVKIKEIV